MRTVGEAAAQRDLFDVAEGLLQVRVPQLQLADAGRVEDHAAVRQHDELPPGRRVTAAVVVAHLARLLQVGAGERVHQRRLADAGGAEQHGGPVPPEPGAHVVEPCRGKRRHREDGARTEGHRLGLGQERRDVVDEVDLRQEHDGLRTALPRHRQITLEAACVEVERQRLDQEGDVDVRREHLLARGVQRLLARQHRATWQHLLDERRFGTEPDPVADRR